MKSSPGSLALFRDLISPDGPELGRLDDTLERVARVDEDLRHIFHGDLTGRLDNDLSAAAGSVIDCKRFKVSVVVARDVRVLP